MLSNIFVKGIPARIPTKIDVIRREIKALKRNFKTIRRSIITPAITMRKIYAADIVEAEVIVNAEIEDYL